MATFENCLRIVTGPLNADKTGYRNDYANNEHFYREPSPLTPDIVAVSGGNIVCYD